MALSTIVTFSSRNMGRSQEEILTAMDARFASIASLSPDLVVFPEEVLISGGDKTNPNWEKNNADALALSIRWAKALHTNVCVNLEEPSRAYPGKRYNTVYVIDRAGEILGKYRKRHITFRAIGADGLPGERIITVDTDIGRLGILVCFDIGWRDDWAALEKAGAELVVWPSAYHGGNLINAYAAVHMMPIVTSVWNDDCRIVDALGDTIAEGTRWDPCVTAKLDLKAEVFHFDHHETLLPRLREAYGDRIAVRVEGRGNLFTLSVVDPALTPGEIKARFPMQTYREYHRGATRDNLEILKSYPEVDS
ncbi:MAG: carbon-nitrogen hydrolase family protein [Clostridia bacterium]|nr:carbon-nitrogen hydrolase family protein [Clostridia bacterium]